MAVAGLIGHVNGARRGRSRVHDEEPGRGGRPQRGAHLLGGDADRIDAPEAFDLRRAHARPGAHQPLPGRASDSAAAPGSLGLLRDALGSATLRAIEAEFPLVLVKATPAEAVNVRTPLWAAAALRVAVAGPECGG